MDEFEQGALAIAGYAVTQDEIMHAPADVERIDLHIAKMRQRGGDIGERLIQAECAAQEAAGNRGRDVQRGRHGGQRRQLAEACKLGRAGSWQDTGGRGDH